MVIYRVREGDTLHGVARMHGVLPTRLAEDNGLSPDTAPTVGQALLIRSPDRVHRVEIGESVADIAARHRLSRARLHQLNSALGEAPPYPGMTLTLSSCEAPHGALLVLGYALAATPPEELKRYIPYLSYLAILSCRLSAVQGLMPPDDAALIALARRGGAAPLLTVQTTGADLAALLEPARRETTVEALVTLLRGRGSEGVLLEVDGVEAAGEGDTLWLLGQLRRHLGHGATVLFSQPPSACPSRALGRAATALLMETHAFSGRFSSPEPATPYDKVKAAVEKAAASVRPSKLLMGISTRAEDFAVQGGGGRVLPYAEVAARATGKDTVCGFDPVGRIPYLSYREEDTDRILFYEDVGSLLEKLMLLEHCGLGGIALHPLVGTATPLLLLIAELFRIIKPHGEQ